LGTTLKNLVIRVIVSLIVSIIWFYNCKNKKQNFSQHFETNIQTTEVDILKTQKGSIIISTTPYEAYVYLDGKFQSKTPLKLSLEPDIYFLSITTQGYEKYNEELKLKSGQILTRNISLKKIIQTPSNLSLNLPDSSYSSSQTYKPPEPSISPDPLNKSIENFIPSKSIEKATLIIQSDPVGAEIYINDKYIAKITPCEIEVTQSKIKILLKKKRFYNWEKIVELKQKIYINYCKSSTFIRKMGLITFIISINLYIV